MFMRFIFLLLVLCAVAFADVGPGPAKPDITVTFTKGGVPYGTDATLVFHCLENVSGEGAVGEDEITFTCSAGVCRDDYWFYKFNPCFNANRGYFTYALEGDALKNSSEFAFTETGRDIVINADDGAVSKGQNLFLCPGSFILLALLSLMALK